MPVNQSLETGGPAAGGEALGYAAPGLGLPLGVVSTPPRKVPTFPEGNPGVFACAADPRQSVQKSCFFSHAQKIRKKSQNCLPRGTQMEPEISKIAKKCLPGAS